MTNNPVGCSSLDAAIDFIKDKGEDLEDFHVGKLNGAVVFFREVLGTVEGYAFGYASSIKNMIDSLKRKGVYVERMDLPHKLNGRALYFRADARKDFVIRGAA